MRRVTIAILIDNEGNIFYESDSHCAIVQKLVEQIFMPKERGKTPYIWLV